MNTLKPDNIFAEHYQLIKLVDTGGFAEVWKALFTGEIVALKIFPKLNEEGIEKVRTEYAQSKLLHTHLIVPSHFGVYDNQPYLVMKFCEGGNASSKIEQSDEAELAKCLYHVAGALAYLHHKDYVHQDIKPNNILLDEDGDYYLTDLGLSIKLRQVVRRFTQGMKDRGTEVNSKNTTAIGVTPPCYRAPELDRNSSASKPPIKATDVWALGATIFEIASGDVPFGDAGGTLQLVNPEPPDMPDKFSPGLNKIIKKCLAKETWDRPKANELEEWAGYYLKNGYWQDKEVEPSASPIPPNLPPQSSTLLAPTTSINFKGKANIPDDQQTVLSEQTKNQDNVHTADKRKRRRLLMLLLWALIAGGAAWGIYAYTHRGQLTGGANNNQSSTSQETSGSDKNDTTGKGHHTVTKTDADNDGVIDSIDTCPKTQNGVKVNEHGCPITSDDKIINSGTNTKQKVSQIKDKDNDGIPNSEDNCIDRPGPRWNNGCPTN